MCEKCEKKSKIDKWKYFGGIVTAIIFLAGQIFLYGQLTSEVKTHSNNTTIHQLPENMEKYLTESEFSPYKDQMNRIESKIDDLNNYLRDHGGN